MDTQQRQYSETQTSALPCTELQQHRYRFRPPGMGLLAGEYRAQLSKDDSPHRVSVTAPTVASRVSLTEREDSSSRCLLSRYW